MRIALGIVAACLVAYLVVLALLYAGQRAMLFPASRLSVTAAGAGLVGFDDVALTTEDGETLQAWWKPPEPGRALVLYFHGNGGSLWNRRLRAGLLTQDGRGLLMVSYRGYAGSTGTPSEEGLRQDARAAYRWLGSFSPARLVVYGESLGTGVAVWLASRERVGAVVLDAPYTSTADVAQALFRFVPVTLLMRDQFRSIDRVSEIKAPLLVMHGEEDGVIPIAQSKALFAAANEPKRYLALPGVDHVSVLERGGLAAVREVMAAVEATAPAAP